MKNFSVSENATRKSVFEYNRIHVKGGWEARNHRLSPTSKFGTSKVVRNAIIESNKRISYSAAVPSMREQFVAKVCDHASAFASLLPLSGYSMGEYKSIKVKHIGIVSKFDNTQEYAKSCKYRANHGHVEVELPLSLVMQVEALSGMLTILGKQVQKNIWKCQWVVFDCERNKRGFITSDVTYRIVDGYVAKYERADRWNGGAVNDYYYHTDTLAQARVALKKGEQELKDLRAWFKKAASDRKKADAERAKKLRLQQREEKKRNEEIAKAMKGMAKNEVVASALNHMYVYADSIKAGNCVPGTNAFLRDHNIEKDETRSGAVLLRLARKSYRTANVVSMLINYIKAEHPEFTGIQMRAAVEYFHTL